MLLCAKHLKSKQQLTSSWELTPTLLVAFACISIFLSTGKSTGSPTGIAAATGALMNGSENITQLGFNTAKRLDPKLQLWVWAKGTRWARVYTEGSKNKWAWHPWVIRGTSTDYSFPPDWRPTKEQIKVMKKLRKEANNKDRRASEHGIKTNAARTEHERQWVTIHVDAFAGANGSMAQPIFLPAYQPRTPSQE